MNYKTSSGPSFMDPCFFWRWTSVCVRTSAFPSILRLFFSYIFEKYKKLLSRFFVLHVWVAYLPSNTGIFKVVKYVCFVYFELLKFKVDSSWVWDTFCPSTFTSVPGIKFGFMCKCLCPLSHLLRQNLIPKPGIALNLQNLPVLTSGEM